MSGKENKNTGADQRRWPRLNPEDIPALKGVELCQDTDVEIVNISRGGLLLETEARLRPDWTIMLKVVTTKGVFLIDGTILRSTVHSLKGAPRYRTAIQFKKPLDLLDKVKDEAVKQIHEHPQNKDREQPPLSSEQNDHEAGNEKSPTILTVVARDAEGIRLKESFSLEDS